MQARSAAFAERPMPSPYGPGTRDQENHPYFAWPDWLLVPAPCVLQVIEAGANALVAGSAVFGAKDYKEGECLRHSFASITPQTLFTSPTSPCQL